MDNQLDHIEKQLQELTAKTDAVYRSSEKMRKYFLWTLIITIIVVIVPLLILPTVIPSFLQSVSVPTDL